jgi:diguanylate cyclase (GGDEF)-like protein
MFSFSQFDKDDLFQSYKRQTYLIAFPSGILLIILYVVNTPAAGILLYYPAALMVAELILFTFLIWRNSNFINTVELFFYFSLSAYFFLIIQITISHLVTTNLLTLGNLSEQLNGLSMWLIVLLFGAFFTLKPAHTRLLIVCVFIGMFVMFIGNIYELSIAGQLTFPFIFRWINPLSCLALTVLLVERMGLLQQSHASTDALTGILNRHALYHVLAQEVEGAMHYKKPFSIILFDIDEFKAVNDTFGHLEGDKVLRELSKLVSGLMRKTDFVGRWGGEEFLVVLTETDSDTAQVLAQRFRAKIEETRFLEKYSIAASFGVATYELGGSLQDLLECADVALYQAKDGGRNQVVVRSMTKV